VALPNGFVRILHELIEVDGLGDDSGDIGMREAVEDLGSRRGHHEDRRCGALARGEVSDDSDAVDARHHQVEDEEIERVVIQHPDGVGAVRDARNLASAARKNTGHERANRGVVVNDEDPHPAGGTAHVTRPGQ
jgi:hypothetical protein